VVGEWHEEKELCMSRSSRNSMESQSLPRGTGHGNDGDLISEKYLLLVPAESGVELGAGQDRRFGRGSRAMWSTGSPQG